MSDIPDNVWGGYRPQQEPSPSSEKGATPCREDGRCQYAIDHGTEGLAVCPVGKCASPAATPRTDLFALEKMYQASAGVLAEDEAILQLLDFARTLERENADLRRQLAKHERRYIDITMLTPHTEVAKIAFAGLAAIKEST